MSQLNAQSFVVPTWVSASLLQGTLRGIERESLRMQQDGYLSQLSHPKALGSALTHPHITTDYSEALLEFITPPQQSIAEALAYLKDIHTVVNQHLAEGEKLWPMSMPCMLDQDEQQIRLADYGSSNLGLFKTLYRKGLGVRYGRRMQTIAGVHYNISFPEQLFIELQKHERDAQLRSLSLQDYRSQRYFGMIRNFIRLTPMVMYLLGASPTVCRSFLIGREHHLLPLTGGTLHLPYATALRMGRHGYQNSAQKQLGIHYNNLQAYLTGLQRAIKTPYPEFSALGLENEHGEPTQINDHVLQIENEYYSLIRPKQIPQGNETPSQALQNRGVAYVELRAVDVNPYSPIGIDEQSAAFLEVLALYCLLQDSPEISATEQDQIEQNQIAVVERGREPNLSLQWGDQHYAISDWFTQQLSAMQPIAALFDQQYGNHLYRTALDEMSLRATDAAKTLSAQVIHDMLGFGGTWKMGSHLAQMHTQNLEAYELSAEKQNYFSELADQSIKAQQQLEQQSEQPFLDYLQQFR
ncbi:glutamate--cysteine ligase [Acinetobacter sp. MD2(2019)]|uniref:glutamate--cysteine ligase n=1 Tax=Acinetobacter sp. MD2(2019) TaxID=2605273 RepID=UPI002D1F9A0D|nr:glutamate--cysteine ligase [Acinetobacter sp. MD2(2019)]MEB3754925.1 glutamate--cysteine ligase [Acinetobacter sp. MD2(2019)]